MIGSTFTVGDGTAPSCPLWLAHEGDEVIQLDENNSEVGDFTAQGSLADNIIYTVEDSEKIYNDGINRKQIANKLVISPSGQLTYKTPPDYDYDDGEGNDSGVFQITLIHRFLKEIF